MYIKILDIDKPCRKRRHQDRLYAEKLPQLRPAKCCQKSKRECDKIRSRSESPERNAAYFSIRAAQNHSAVKPRTAGNRFGIVMMHRQVDSISEAKQSNGGGGERQLGDPLHWADLSNGCCHLFVLPVFIGAAGAGAAAGLF